MRAVLVMVSLLALPALRCDAADARTFAPKIVTIETHPDYEFGPLLLRAEVLPPGREWARISSLTIRWRGRDITMPSEAYSDLRGPDAASFHCGVWLPAPDRPELEVTFTFSDPRYVHRMDMLPRAQLLVVEGRVVSRTIRWFTRTGEEKRETKQFKT